MINPGFQPSQTQSGLLTRCGSMSSSYASGPKIDPCIPHMSLVGRKPAFCICENKDADQLRGDREADQCLCFRYADSTIPFQNFKLLGIFCGLCWTWSETPKTGFLMTRLIYSFVETLFPSSTDSRRASCQ